MSAKLLQLCPALCNPMNYSPPGSSVHRILQARILEWVAISICSVQSLKSCPTLYDPTDCNTPGFPVHYQLPELTQTHVHRVSDAIQSSYPLSYPSPPTFNLSQDQFFLVSQFFASSVQSTGVSASASVLPMNIQD